MADPVPTYEATLFTRLPAAFHYTGEPTDWVRATRPGERLHSFLEGPCFDRIGRLWLADVPYGRIFRVAQDGSWTLALQYDGEPHGLALLPDGRFAVADYRRGLLAFDSATGSIETLCDRANTEHFRGLGDVAMAPNGELWLSDTGRSSLSDPIGRVFRLQDVAGPAKLVLINVPYPNGIAFSPDGRFVYLSVTRANAIWRFLANAPDPGMPMVGVFLHLSGGVGPDGLATDGAGRLYVVQAQAGRVLVFDCLGDPVARIRTPGGLWTTAAALSPDGKSLFILEAQQGAVFRFDLSRLPEACG